MGHNSETKTYPKTNSGEEKPRAAKPRASRNRSGKRVVLAVTLTVLLVIVLIAVVFVIRDLALQERDPSGEVTPTTDPAGSATEGTAAPGNTPDLDPSKHPAAHAIDGNDATYMISDKNQAVGAFLQLNLGAETDVMNVEILSNSDSAYIRHAEIWTSADSTNWPIFGEFSGTPSDPNPKTVTKGVAVKASYVRIVLMEKADAQWLIQTVNVIDQNGNAVNIAQASVGVVSGNSVQTDAESTNAGSQGGFVAKIVQNADIYTGDLIVVNAKHQYMFPASTADILPMFEGKPDATLPNGTKVTAYKVGGSSLPALKANALTAFNSMAVALTEGTGIAELEIGTNDAWRSRETQADLYAKYPTSASPTGQSEHNTGLGVNINLMVETGGIYYLNESDAHPACATVYNWLTANAYKYGFVERFPASKKAQTGVTDNYHYRYVGYAHAFYMKQYSLCLEEYVDMLHSYTYSGNHLSFSGDNGKSYEIYYIPMDQTAASTQLYVPQGTPYTVSGDNYSGFIVTIEK